MFGLQEWTCPGSLAAQTEARAQFCYELLQHVLLLHLTGLLPDAHCGKRHWGMHFSLMLHAASFFAVTCQVGSTICPNILRLSALQVAVTIFLLE